MSAQDFRILVVMDAPNDRKLMVKVLTETFKVNNVMQTHTPSNALNMIKGDESVHLIICDLDLPKISGFDFIKKIRTMDNAKGAAIIMTSSSKERDTLVKAVAAGVKDYIVRPFNLDKLKQRLHKFFQNNQGKLRETKRISLFESYKAQIAFSEKGIYKGHLLDLSLGGCLIRTPVFNKSRQTIYDQAEILIDKLAPVTIKAELVRLETDPDSESKDKTRTMKAAFKFLTIDNGIMNQLTDLLKNPTANPAPQKINQTRVDDKKALNKTDKKPEKAVTNPIKKARPPKKPDSDDQAA